MSATDFQHPGSASNCPVHDIVREQDVVCHFVLMELLHTWPEEPDEVTSSGLLDHVDHCPRCLKRLIAFEAAVELAEFSCSAQ